MPAVVRRRCSGIVRSLLPVLQPCTTKSVSEPRRPYPKSRLVLATGRSFGQQCVCGGARCDGGGCRCRNGDMANSEESSNKNGGCRRRTRSRRSCGTNNSRSQREVMERPLDMLAKNGDACPQHCHRGSWRWSQRMILQCGNASCSCFTPFPLTGVCLRSNS